MISGDDLEKAISEGMADSPTAMLLLAGAVLVLSQAIRETAAEALLPCEEPDADVTPCGQRQVPGDEFPEPPVRGTLPIEEIRPSAPVPATVGGGCACQHPPLPSSLGGPR